MPWSPHSLQQMAERPQGTFCLPSNFTVKSVEYQTCLKIPQRVHCPWLPGKFCSTYNTHRKQWLTLCWAHYVPDTVLSTLFTCVYPFNHHKNHSRLSCMVTLFYRWGNWGWVQLRDLLGHMTHKWWRQDSNQAARLSPLTLLPLSRLPAAYVEADEKTSKQTGQRWPHRASGSSSCKIRTKRPAGQGWSEN